MALYSVVPQVRKYPTFLRNLPVLPLLSIYAVYTLNSFTTNQQNIVKADTSTSVEEGLIILFEGSAARRLQEILKSTSRSFLIRNSRCLAFTFAGLFHFSRAASNANSIEG